MTDECPKCGKADMVEQYPNEIRECHRCAKTFDSLTKRYDRLRHLLTDCRPYLVSLAEHLHECPLKLGAIGLRRMIDAELKLPGTPDGDRARGSTSDSV